MATSLAKQLAARMKAKNLTTTMLEREAKLGVNTVRNILNGISKNPSAQTLRSIADILNCTVDDLLTNKEGLFADDYSMATKEGELNELYNPHDKLLAAVVKLVNERVAKFGKTLTVYQVLTCIEEVFLHCLAKKPPSLDAEFVDWFMNLMTKSTNLDKR